MPHGTPQLRSREAGERVRAALLAAAAACGIALLAVAPFVGWWFLTLFGAVAALVLTTDRCASNGSARPELVDGGSTVSRYSPSSRSEPG